MVWGIFKKVFGGAPEEAKPEKPAAPAVPAPQPLAEPAKPKASAPPPAVPAAAAPAAVQKAVASEPAASPAQKPEQEPPASAKPRTEEDEIEEELKKVPHGIMSQLRNPAVRGRVMELAKKMMKDGVSLKSEKQIKEWLQNHPEETQAPERQRIETFRREEPKTGRNDPCPCGSGKKYKKCCGNKS